MVLNCTHSIVELVNFRYFIVFEQVFTGYMSWSLWLMSVKLEPMAIHNSNIMPVNAPASAPLAFVFGISIPMKNRAKTGAPVTADIT